MLLSNWLFCKVKFIIRMKQAGRMTSYFAPKFYVYANFHDHLENNNAFDDIIQIEFKIQSHRLLKF
jgi:hypothetical protein